MHSRDHGISCGSRARATGVRLQLRAIPGTRFRSRVEARLERLDTNSGRATVLAIVQIDHSGPSRAIDLDGDGRVEIVWSWSRLTVGEEVVVLDPNRTPPSIRLREPGTRFEILTPDADGRRSLLIEVRRDSWAVWSPTGSITTCSAIT